MPRSFERAPAPKSVPKQEEIPYLDDADVELIEESETPVYEKEMSVRVRAEDWDEEARAPKREDSEQVETKEAMMELVQKVREEMKSWSPEKVAAYLKEVGQKVKKEWDALISAQTLIVPEEEVANQIEVGDEVRPVSTPGGRSQYRIPEQKWVEIRKSRLLKLYKKVLSAKEQVSRLLGSILILGAPGVNEEFLEDLKKEQKSDDILRCVKWLFAHPRWEYDPAELEADKKALQEFLTHHPEGGAIAQELMREDLTIEDYKKIAVRWNAYAKTLGSGDGPVKDLAFELPGGILSGAIYGGGIPFIGFLDTDTERTFTEKFEYVKQRNKKG